MLDRDDELVADRAGRGERRLRLLDANGDVAADELELPVRAQDPGQETRPRRGSGSRCRCRAPARRRRANSRTASIDGREPRDRAAAQVVAVGEPAGEDDAGGLGRQLATRRARRAARRPRASRARARRRGRRSSRGRRRRRSTGAESAHSPSTWISTLSISGFASSSAHIRSTWARASAGSAASSSRSTSRPTRACGDREVELAQRAADRLALRVEDPGLGANEDGRLHPSTTRGVGEVVVERDLGQPLERLDVAAARAGDEIVGQLGPGRRLVPADRLAPVAHELLVERGLRAAGLVAVGRPEAGRVGGQRLVTEHDPARPGRHRTRTSCRRR